MARVLAGAILAAGLAACGSEPLPEAVPVRPVVSPGDFVLLPCHAVGAEPCALVLAGGKTLMFGAPGGAGLHADPRDLADLGALFLFSIHPEDIEGVDEVRNRGWRAGRADPLPVAGPVGTAALVSGLNLAFEQPDAISFVEDGAPAGGFDAALLSLVGEVEDAALVYDSGDLKVFAAVLGVSALGYRVEYRDLDETWHAAVMIPCIRAAGAAPDWSDALAETELLIGCERANAPSVDQGWPLTEAVFAVKSER